MDHQPPPEFPDLPSLKARLQEAEEKVLLYRYLVKSPGWEDLVKIAQTQANQRTGELLNAIGAQTGYEIVQVGGGQQAVPIDGLSRLAKQEFDKGVRAGILMFVDFPRAITEHFDSIAKEIRELLEREGTENG